MWENQIDQAIIESTKCKLCRETQCIVQLPCRKHSICIDCLDQPRISNSKEKRDDRCKVVIKCPYGCGEYNLSEGQYPLPALNSELVEVISRLRTDQGTSCELHVLHEKRYRCLTCDDQQVICLICFAEKHISHVIKEVPRAANPAGPTSFAALISASIAASPIVPSLGDDSGGDTAPHDRNGSNHNQLGNKKRANSSDAETSSKFKRPARNSFLRIPSPDSLQETEQDDDEQDNDQRADDSAEAEADVGNNADADSDANNDDSDSGTIRSEEEAPELSFSDKLRGIGLTPVAIKEEKVVKTAKPPNSAAKKNMEKKKSKVVTFSERSRITRKSLPKRVVMSESDDSDDPEESKGRRSSADADTSAKRVKGRELNSLKPAAAAKKLLTRRDSKAELEREEKWDRHFFALLAYGEDNKSSEGVPNYNVPKDFVYGTGEDKLALGAWVNKLDFRNMTDDRSDRLGQLFEIGDFTIIFKEKKKSNTSEAKASNGNERSSSSSSSSSSSKPGASRPRVTTAAASSNQLQQQLMRIKSDPDSAAKSSSSPKTTQSTADKSALPAPAVAPPITPAPAPAVRSLVWRSRKPAPVDLKKGTCILHYQSKISSNGEVKKFLSFGQIKSSFDASLIEFSQSTKVVTCIMVPSNASDVKSSTFEIIGNSERLVKVEDVLLHGLSLVEGDYLNF
jgi:hypothetical protein